MKNACFSRCRALTATSDSADEDDEKEVAELERELSRCSEK